MLNILSLVRLYDRKDKNLRKIVLSSEETIIIDLSKEDEELFRLSAANQMHQDPMLYVLLIMYLVIYIAGVILYLLPSINLYRCVMELISTGIINFMLVGLYYKHYATYIAEFLLFIQEHKLVYQITDTKSSWFSRLYIKTILSFIVVLCLVIYGWTLKELEPKIILGLVFIIPNYLFTIYLSNVLLFSKYKKNVDKFMDAIEKRY